MCHDRVPDSGSHDNLSNPPLPMQPASSALTDRKPGQNPGYRSMFAYFQLQRDIHTHTHIRLQSVFMKSEGYCIPYMEDPFVCSTEIQVEDKHNMPALLWE